MSKKNLWKPLLSWCSANSDNREIRFIQIGVSLIEHQTFAKLTGSEFKLYILMLKVAGPTREFILPRSVYEIYLAPSTFNKARDGLVQKGLIETVYSGKNTREASKYRFSFRWKDSA